MLVGNYCYLYCLLISLPYCLLYYYYYCYLLFNIFNSH
nr:MAG TPA: hypothetical protein [Caudoviricetes sp.]